MSKNSESESESKDRPLIPTKIKKDKKSSESESSSYKEEEEIKHKKDYTSSEDSDYVEEKPKKKLRKKKTPEKLLNKKKKKDSNKKKKSKKNKKKINNNNLGGLIDKEAEENEESSSEEGEISEETKEQMIKRYDDEHLKKKTNTTNINQLTDAQIKEKVKEYEKQEEENSVIDKAIDTTIVRKDDPKLFLVKCKIGKEREVCEILYNKYFTYNRKELNLPYEEKIKIFSVFSFDSLKGFIYVEAYNATHVRQACKNISSVFENDNAIRIIPDNEMKRVFDYDRFKEINIKIGDYVRVKSGPYENDLAQIVLVEDKLNKIYIKLVPRLERTDETTENPKNNEEEKSEQKRKESDGSKLSNNDIGLNMSNHKNSIDDKNNNDNSQDKDKEKDKQDKEDANVFRNNKFFRRKMKARPVPKLININSHQAIMADKQKIKGETIYVIGKQYYNKEGFLIKKVRFTSILANNINPSFEELKVFQNTIGDDTNVTLLNQKLLNLNMQKFNIKFNKGDRVMLTLKDLKGITGKVVSHDKGLVRLIPNVKEFSNEVIEVPENNVIKQFLPGEIITVIDGPDQGKKGMIISLKENNTIAEVYNDVTKNFFSVPCDYLILSSQIVYNSNENSLFRIGDLVKILNSNDFCYVLNTSAYTINVVSVKNEVMSLSIRDVEKIKVNKKLSGMDSKRNPINKENRVKVLDGQFAGKIGTVKYIFRNYVFLHNVEFVRSNGIFCETNDNVEILGAELLNDYGNNGRVNQRKIPDDIKSYLGKTILIKGGNYKGYEGIVVKLGDKFLSIELSAYPKTVNIEIEHISLDKKENVSESPNLAGKTPAYYHESQQSDYDANYNKK